MTNHRQVEEYKAIRVIDSTVNFDLNADEMARKGWRLMKVIAGEGSLDWALIWRRPYVEPAKSDDSRRIVLNCDCGHTSHYEAPGSDKVTVTCQECGRKAEL